MLNTMDPNDLEEYLSSHTTPEDDVLHELNRLTNLTTYHPRMISGPIQGRLLNLISTMVSPRRALEIGTFTGYSSICMARGLNPDGHLHTIEVNDELADTALSFFSKAGLAERITLHVGNAIDVIPTLNDTFDLVLIDGDKREYPQYLELLAGKVRSGGIIIADNVIWDGKVMNPECNDPFTNALRQFNRMVNESDEYENVLLPLRDGLMLIIKK